jgi:hypothetical protein
VAVSELVRDGGSGVCHRFHMSCATYHITLISRSRRTMSFDEGWQRPSSAPKQRPSTDDYTRCVRTSLRACIPCV